MVPLVCVNGLCTQMEHLEHLEDLEHLEHMEYLVQLEGMKLVRLHRTDLIAIPLSPSTSVISLEFHGRSYNQDQI